MNFSKCPSKEEIELLEELSVGTALRETSVLAHVPDWSTLIQSHVISSSTASLLNSLPSLGLTERMEKTIANVELCTLPLKVLEQNIAKGPVLQYILTFYYDMIRSNTALLDKILIGLQGDKTLKIFTRFFENPNLDVFLGDKAIFLLSSLIPRSNADVFTPDDVLILLDNILDGGWKLSDYGRLDSLKNIMKAGNVGVIHSYRSCVLEKKKAQELILTHLDSMDSSVYPAVFCVWVATFDGSLLNLFMKLGVLEKICNILRHCKTEKVVRACTGVLLNCLSHEASIEALIDQNAVQALTLLEYDKWRDEELYDEIRNVLCALQQKIKLLSNFERYCRELETRKLHWSYLHSEKFWRENFNHFEENEFMAVKRLTLLLRSDDPVTAAVACFDIGEFARLHPMGKIVLRNIKAKEMVIFLMSHKNRDVSREALLCVQKIMLDHWQKAVTA